jgi:hypothetical protein
MAVEMVAAMPEHDITRAQKAFDNVEEQLDFGNTYMWSDFGEMTGVEKPDTYSEEFTDWVWNFWIPFRDIAQANGFFLSERGVDGGFRILDKTECGTHVKQFISRCLKSIRKKINGLQSIDTSDMVVEERRKLENEEKRAVWIAELTSAVLRKRKLSGPSTPKSIRKMLNDSKNI